jgi:hypothetical protein
MINKLEELIINLRKYKIKIFILWFIFLILSNGLYFLAYIFAIINSVSKNNFNYLLYFIEEREANIPSSDSVSDLLICSFCLIFPLFYPIKPLKGFVFRSIGVLFCLPMFFMILVSLIRPLMITFFRWNRYADATEPSTIFILGGIGFIILGIAEVLKSKE